MITFNRYFDVVLSINYFDPQRQNCLMEVYAEDYWNKHDDADGTEAPQSLVDHQIRKTHDL